MNEAQTLFAALRQSADPDVVCAIEALVRDAPDNRLNRINALAFAAKTGLNEDRVIAPFLHAAEATGVGRQTVWGKGQIALTNL